MNDIDICEQDPKKTSKRGKRISSEGYKDNPFLEGGKVFKTRNRMVSVYPEKNVVLADRSTGEIVEPTTIATFHEVDSEQFIKLYTNQIKVLFELSPSSFRLMEVIFLQVQAKAMNRDVIYLNANMCETYFNETARPPMAKPTFFRALRELMEKNILAASVDANLFFFNPAIFFNGDRVKFVTEYKKKKESSMKTLEDKGQGRFLFDGREE